MNKDRNKKTIHPKSTDICINVPAHVIADIVGCSTSLVKQVRRGLSNESTVLCKRIKITEELLMDGSNLLLKEIKRIVTI